MSDKRAELVFKAKLAEQSERFDEMAEFMKEVASMPEPLSVEERNLLSVGYKNAVGARRASWRIISNAELKERTRSQGHAPVVEEYRKQIEAELAKICGEIISLLDKDVIPNATTGESKVFYYKMKGDYYRYISEFEAEEAKKEASAAAHEAYTAATQIATTELFPTHPIRLGLALNFSVFYWEILGDQAGACEMAKLAFQDAIAELDNVPEESYKDSTLIMQLLRDNLTLWTSQMQANSNEESVAPNP